MKKENGNLKIWKCENVEMQEGQVSGIHFVHIRTGIVPFTYSTWEGVFLTC